MNVFVDAFVGVFVDAFVDVFVDVFVVDLERCFVNFFIF